MFVFLFGGGIFSPAAAKHKRSDFSGLRLVDFPLADVIRPAFGSLEPADCVCNRPCVVLNSSLVFGGVGIEVRRNGFYVAF